MGEFYAKKFILHSGFRITLRKVPKRNCKSQTFHLHSSLGIPKTDITDNKFVPLYWLLSIVCVRCLS